VTRVLQHYSRQSKAAESAATKAAASVEQPEDALKLHSQQSYQWYMALVVCHTNKNGGALDDQKSIFGMVHTTCRKPQQN